ncbi:hypothetical protein KP509_21G019200 [Ceratopteris richardii]|uniref:AtTam37 zinc finger domain-containing protein n=1 Tax=Ceratopteris richardii TaxID=49495 RepID=A0A8T2S965_CERRI|nr:hypothetical protein KP509_21G019200 [Ceratopteris richardii]
MDKFFSAAKKTFTDAGTVFREAAHDAAYDLRDNALRGFGLPRLLTSAASFSVAGCAAIGTLAITCEMISKMHVRRDCRNCNGFGGLRCTACLGKGHVQYSSNAVSKTKKSSISNLANDILEGKEEVINYPPGYNAGYPLPYRECPTCSGTGVAICQMCNGYPLQQPHLSFDNLMDVPWKTWNAHRRTHPPQIRRLSENIKDPDLAAFLLFEKDEIERGVKYDEDTKAQLMASYLRDVEYDDVRKLVADRQPGWEQLQEALQILDPERAKTDPVIVQDVPHYKARMLLEADVASMEVPPRPTEWTKYLPLLKEKYGGNTEEKAALSISEIRTMVDLRESLIEQVLDAGWANEWRQRKVKEMIEEKIGPYVEAEETGNAVAPASGLESNTSDIERPSKKSGKAGKSGMSEKRKERQERMAKLAAEREAALAQAKIK